MSPFISSISGARGGVRNTPCKSRGVGAVDVGDALARFQSFRLDITALTLHPLSRLPSKSRAGPRRWATGIGRHSGRPAAGNVWPEHPAGARPVTPPHEVAKVSSGTGGPPLGLSRKRRRTWTTKQPPARLQLPGSSGPGERGGPRPFETPPIRELFAREAVGTLSFPQFVFQESASLPVMSLKQVYQRSGRVSSPGPPSS